MSSSIPDGPGVQTPPMPSASAAHIAVTDRILVSAIAGVGLLIVSALVAAFRQQAWEYPLIRLLNAGAGRSALLDRAIHALTTRDLLEGVVFITFVWFLWFRNADNNARARLLIGSTAVAFAGIASRLLQLGLPTHLRPLHTQAIGFVLPGGVEPEALNHFNSFPSDHGAVYFTLALVIFRIHQRLGVVALTWAMIVNMARIYDGYHYPSDVIGSVGLGLLIIALFENRWCEGVAHRVLALEETCRPWFYMLAFLASYLIATLFDDLRQLGRGFAGVILHHDPFGSG